MACPASWRLQLGAEPATRGDAGRVTLAAVAQLGLRCDADSVDACLQLGQLTNWKHASLNAAQQRARDACRADDLAACRTSASLASRLDGADALSDELEALENRAKRVCGSSGPLQLSGCAVWSEVERGFIFLPTGRIELDEVPPHLRSIDRLTAGAAAVCRSDEARCAGLVELARQVRADACWSHESCPTDTETLMREACRGGSTLACQLRESSDLGASACAAGDGAACLVSAQWLSWRGLDVVVPTLAPLCSTGQLEACHLASLPVPPPAGSCSSAVDCDTACRRGDGRACRQLASSIDTLRPGEALAVQTLETSCAGGHASACKTWARGLDLHGGVRSGVLERELLTQCRAGDAASCVWTARFQGRVGLEELEKRALADCSQTNPGACAWAAAAEKRLRDSRSASGGAAPNIAKPLVGTAEQDCDQGDRRACNALGLAATGRTLPLPSSWSALEGPLPDRVLEPLTALSLPEEMLRRDAWEGLAKAGKKPCQKGDREACGDVVAGQMWTLETCPSAKCSRVSSQALCGLGVTPLCEGAQSGDLATTWSATLQSATVGDERLVADLRSRCLKTGETDACVATAAEVLRREVVATPHTPDDRAALEVACRSGADFACTHR